MSSIPKRARAFTNAASLVAAGVLWLTGAAPGRASETQRYFSSGIPSPLREPLGFHARTNHHGWTNSILVSNGKVEVVIVPDIGRVMQFRFAGEAEGPFWENTTLFGKAPDPKATEWVNFGGDKTWPSPQGDWERNMLRKWPPPEAFDAMPVEVGIDGQVVTIVTPVDPHFGIRARRRIELDIDLPVMTITTTYEKVSGLPMEIGVWVITQLKHPVGVYAIQPDFSRYRDGYNRQSDELPTGLQVGKGLLSLTRDSKTPHKIGTDASTLVWVGTQEVLRIDSARRFDGHYPDQESSAEIYTNPDPLAYVELEMLGPVQHMIIGNKLSRTSTYTLLHRAERDPDLEVQRMAVH
jgi:hypothetical protein